jgi:hypothetical protein
MVFLPSTLAAGGGLTPTHRISREVLNIVSGQRLRRNVSRKHRDGLHGGQLFVVTGAILTAIEGRLRQTAAPSEKEPDCASNRRSGAPRVVFAARCSYASATERKGDATMPRPPNYNHERKERDRIKAAKKAEKLAAKAAKKEADTQAEPRTEEEKAE